MVSNPMAMSFPHLSLIFLIAIVVPRYTHSTPLGRRHALFAAPRSVVYPSRTFVLHHPFAPRACHNL